MRCLRARFCNGADVFGTCYCQASGTLQHWHWAANQRYALYFRLHVAMTTTSAGRLAGTDQPKPFAWVVPQRSVCCPCAPALSYRPGLPHHPSAALLRLEFYLVICHHPETDPAAAGQLGASAAMATDAVAGFPCALYVISYGSPPYHHTFATPRQATSCWNELPR